MRKKLTRAFILTLFMGFTVKAFCISDKIRIGLYASPGVAWASPGGVDLKKGTPRSGVEYGLAAEFWFAKNYGLVTGLSGAFDGCNIKDRAAFQLRDTTGALLRSVNEKYTFNYLVLPAYLKLKTNQIKSSKFSIWGQLGANINITVSARATYDNPIPVAGDTTWINIEKENILKPKNDVTKSISGFRSNFIDVRLGAGVGFEYGFDDRTALQLGLFYHNGFINNIIDKDAKKEPVVMRMFSVRVGVVF